MIRRNLYLEICFKNVRIRMETCHYLKTKVSFDKAILQKNVGVFDKILFN